MSHRERQIIAVWFSCGAASAVAAKLAYDWWSGDYDVRILNNPVLEEPEDNLRFLVDCEKWIGTKIERITNPKYDPPSCEKVWNDRKFMSGTKGAPCTIELKKHARQIWENEVNPDWHVLGFTSDEKKRFDNFVLTERDNVLNVLGDAAMTKQDCMDFIISEGLEPPVSYKWGLPNANCLGCVKASSPTYWNKIREIAPEVFQKRAETSRRIGARLVRVKNERIFLDELDKDTMGRPLKSLSIECGTWCEENYDEDDDEEDLIG
jgi:hypothetical protein